MAQVLAQEYVLTDRPDDADLYLINTCAIRKKSEQKVRSLLGSLKPEATTPRDAPGGGGCVAQQEGGGSWRRASPGPGLRAPTGCTASPKLVRRAVFKRQVDVALVDGFPPALPRGWRRGRPRRW